ncbi:MAG: hypothetical protein V3G42_08185 [Oscillospiraceae bacterium]
MNLMKVYGEFETEELAELCAGRIRRNVKGIHRLTLRRLSGYRPPEGKVHFTMLPANLRMSNYATDVLYSEIDPNTIPEPIRRQNTELMAMIEPEAEREVFSYFHAMGATNIRKKE